MKKIVEILKTVEKCTWSIQNKSHSSREVEHSGKGKGYLKIT